MADLQEDENFKSKEFIHDEAIAVHLAAIKLEHEEKLFSMNNKITGLMEQVEKLTSENESLKVQYGEKNDSTQPSPAFSKTNYKGTNLEEMVAEEWNLGSAEFSNGNYSNCFKHHTAAVQLLLEAYEDRKYLSQKLKEELIASKDERDFLRTKCSAITDALSSLEKENQKLEKAREIVPKVVDTSDLVESKNNIQDCLKLSDTLDNPLQELVSKKQKLEAKVAKLSAEIEDRKAQEIILEEEIDEIKTMLSSEVQKYELREVEFKKEIDGLREKVFSLEQQQKDSDSARESEHHNIQELTKQIKHFEERESQLNLENTKFMERESNLLKQLEESSDIEQENRDLRQTIEQMEQEKIELLEKLNAKSNEDAKNKELSEEIISLKEAITSLEKAKSTLEDDHKALLEQLSQSEEIYKEFTELSEKIAAVDEEKSSFDAKIKVLEETKSELEITNSSQAEEILRLQAEIKELQENQNSFRESSQEAVMLKQEKLFLEEDLQASTLRIEELEKLLETQKNVKVATEAREELEKEKKTLVEKLAKKEEEVDELKWEIESQTEILNAIEANEEEQKKIQEVEIAKYKEKNDKLTENIKTLETQLADVESKVKEGLESSLASLQKELEREQTTNSNLLDKLNYKELELTGMERENNVLQATVEELKRSVAEIDEYRVELTEKDIVVSELKRALQEKSAANQKLSHKLQAASQPKVIKPDFQAFSETIDSAADYIATVEEKLQLFKAQAQALTERVAVLSSEKQEIKQETLATITTLKEEIASLEQQCEHYKAGQVSSTYIIQETNATVKNLVEEASTIEKELKKCESSRRYKRLKERTAKLRQYKLISKLETHIKDIFSTVTEADSRLADLELANKNVVSTENLKQAQKEIGELKEETVGYKQQIDRLNTTAEELKSATEEKETALAQAKRNLQILEEEVDKLKLEKRKILKDASEYFALSMNGGKEVDVFRDEVDPDLIEKLRTSMQMLDQTISDTTLLGEENWKLKRELKGLKSCFSLQKHLYPRNDESDSEDDLSSIDYLEDSEMSDDEEDGSLNVENEFSDPNPFKETARKEKDLRLKLEKKCDQLSTKIRQLTETTRNSSQLLSPTIEHRNMISTDSSANTGFKVKDDQVEELMELLERHELDIQLLTKELSRLYYQYSNSGEATASSPSSFLRLLRQHVAPNVLVILIAFFSALKDRRF